MIARRRGDDHARNTAPSAWWRYKPDIELHRRAPAGPKVGADGEPTSRRRLALRSLALVVVGALLFFAGHQLIPRGDRALPNTPRQWFDAYEAAVVDDPARVCSELFAPELAAAYAATAHTTCNRRFGRITSTSVQVRRILEDGPTAVVEVRQRMERDAWGVVLDHRAGGWQAVDVVPGTPLR